MKRKIIYLLVALIVGLGLFFFYNQKAAPQSEKGKIAAPASAYDIKTLKNTGNFRAGALEHILEGEVNKAGKATGFHYEGLPSAKGKVIPGTQSASNSFGVYKAKVQVEGKGKSDNNGESTFFPKDWTPQQVVDAINEAYGRRSHRTGNIYAGDTAKGMRINMYLDDGAKIISAFPQY